MNNRLLLVAALVFLAACPAFAATRTWTGAMNNDWYEPGNWSPPGMPDPADTLNVSGTPFISHHFTMTGEINWNASTLAGGLTVDTVGTLNLFDCYLSGPLTNRGRINLQGNRFRIFFSSETFGELWNEPDAILDIQGEVQIERGNWEPTIHNAGVLRKSAGTETTTLGARLENTGTVHAQSGTLLLASPSELARGIFRADAGASVSFDSYLHSIAGTIDWRGPGVVAITGGLTTLSNAAGAILVLGGGVAGVNSAAGTLNMAGGRFMAH